MSDDWEVTPDDIEAAREEWRRASKPQWRALLDAERDREAVLDKRDDETGVEA
jgi:hypothetical protein